MRNITARIEAERDVARNARRHNNVPAHREAIARIRKLEAEAEEKAIAIQDRQNASLDAYDRSQLPEGITIGYIGNLESWGDDRSWHIFRAHPGRVGTPADSIGGFSTATRGKLLPLIRAIVFAKEVA